MFFPPGMWEIKDSVPVTDCFILKTYLGFGMMLFGHPESKR